MAVAMELAYVQEMIAETVLSAKVGETDFPTYRVEIAQLRAQRDGLERRQTNLRGWLVVRDVHMAGGPMETSFENLPGGIDDLAYPAETVGGSSLAERHIELLRTALANRAKADRALHAIGEREGGDAVGGSRADVQADRKRAVAAAGFARERLQQFKLDCATDEEIADAEHDRARQQVRLGDITRAEFDEREGLLLSTKDDLARMSDLAVRALSASVAEDVPSTQKSFLERAAQAAKPARRLAADRMLVSVSVVLLLVSVLLPVGGGLSALGFARRFTSTDFRALWLLTFPIVTAIALLASAYPPARSRRGVALCLVSLVASLLVTYYLHETAYAPTEAAAMLREGHTWLLRPAVAVYALGLLCALGAGVVLLARTGHGRIVPPLTAAVGLAGMALLITDLLGLRLPEPRVLEPSYRAASGEAQYEVTVHVDNPGGRALILSSTSKCLNAYTYILEGRIGRASWADLSVPEVLQVSGVEQAQPTDNLVEAIIVPGEAAALQYHLAPGDYRVLLRPNAGGQEVERGFTLPPLGDAAGKTEIPVPDAEAAAGHTTSAAGDEGATLAPEGMVQLELSGVLDAEKRAPRFSMRLILPDGTDKNGTFSLHDTVYGSWRLGEYNPKMQAVTVTNGEKTVFLYAGKKIELPVEGDTAGETEHGG